MKRILFALTVLIFSNVAFAQNTEKNGEITTKTTNVEQKEQINAKYELIKSQLEKGEYAAAKKTYAAATAMMEQSLDADKKLLRKADGDAKLKLEQKIKTKTHLFDASKPFATVDLAKEGRRYSIYVMEFAFVTGNN